MSAKVFIESEVEQAALEWLEDLGYEIAFGPNLIEGSHKERQSYEDVILKDRLMDALLALNPRIKRNIIEDAVREILIPKQVALIDNNRVFHKMITDGVSVSYHDESGSLKHTQLRLFDFEDPLNNDFLAVNQFTVIENKIEKRPDIVVLVN
ncbi:MAG: type I restriction endonuclease, partial [bacterium]|nr:type I restriction endonuclease [bacterium]